ncbi:MAG TPA: ABC transporter permease [Myxococcales bacterium]|nr:ABC transporter permease [Myxococcales bacterium]
MNAPRTPPAHGHPLVELTLYRLRMFFREPGAIFWTFVFPLLLAIVLGVAFRNRPPEPALIAVESAQMRDAMATQPGINAKLLDDAAAQLALRTGKVDLVVLPGPPVTYRYDPTRPESRLARALADAALHPRGKPDTIDAPVTEPGSRYIDFLIPGLIGMTIMSSGLWGIGYVVVEMRVGKLLKRMVATPMSRAQFLSSFITMRALFLFLELPILIGSGVLLFHVRVAGSLLLIVLLGLLGAIAFAGLGLLVASRAQNLQTAAGLVNLVIMPMFVCSGVFFSIARFPEAVQPVLKVLPLTALNDSLRMVMTDGAGVVAVLPQIAVMAATAVLAFGIALRIFRWR